MSPPAQIRIAVDAMGGDFAPRVNVEGAVSAVRMASGFAVILIGDRPLLERELKHLKALEDPRITILHTDEVVSMAESALQAVRKKPNSSLHRGMELLREASAEAFVSAGHSGAVMAGALLILGRLPGIDRPAIVIRVPTLWGAVVVLDAGANVDCKPNHLRDFAWLGHSYSEIVESVASPRIALLSNGTEGSKGNELTRAADALLSQDEFHYIGYVEGSDLFRGVANVFVCDGFVGNVILKSGEGFVDSCFQWFRKELKRDVLGRVGFLLLKRLLTRFRKKFDYESYGAAPLLGIEGLVYVSHGSSSAVAIRNGILSAKRGVEQNFVARMRSALLAREKRKDERS